MEDKIDQTGQLLDAWRCYAALYHDYVQRGFSKTLDQKDKENAEKVGEEAHYYAIGTDAVRNIVDALASNFRTPPQTILDFPSGSGRVTRHLRSFFPEARLYACDLYEGHIKFCAETFGAVPILSSDELDRFEFPEKFDLIFCGSLLTHLPETQCKQAISLIARSLSPQGIALVTLHGRYSPFVQRNKFEYLRDDLFQVALKGMHDHGFGYADYETDFKSLFDKQERYGVTLARPSWVLQHLEQIEEVRVLSYRERSWDDHQDVVVFGRPGVCEPS
jgi:SAM-dependent methyltransferase